jgi:hypothetical protein
MIKDSGDGWEDPLRELKLEDVAAYLKCDPERLRKLLIRLAITPSAIKYGPDYQAVAITKAIALTAAELEDYLQDSGDEITELEALYSRQDDRHQTHQMKCRKCGANTTRRTHDGPKRGKTMWYAWHFYCPACGWLFMPKDAVRHVDADIAAASPAPTQTDAYRHQDAGDDGRAPW